MFFYSLLLASKLIACYLLHTGFTMVATQHLLFTICFSTSLWLPLRQVLFIEKVASLVVTSLYFFSILAESTYICIAFNLVGRKTHPTSRVVQDCLP